MARGGSRLHKDLRAIGKAFKALAHHFERIAPLLGEHEDVRISGRPGGPRRKRRRLTPARRRDLKLQGRYIGTIRMLPAARKAKVKKVRSEKGIRAAIAYAKKLR
jgi:hypothetical protein